MFIHSLEKIDSSHFHVFIDIETDASKNKILHVRCITKIFIETDLKV